MVMSSEGGALALLLYIFMVLGTVYCVYEVCVLCGHADRNLEREKETERQP